MAICCIFKRERGIISEWVVEIDDDKKRLQGGNVRQFDGLKIGEKEASIWAKK